MTVLHLDAVLAIENEAYPVPWTRGNFIDSIAAGYDAWLLVDARQTLLGYFVAMDGVDEMHLLNLTVALQRRARARDARPPGGPVPRAARADAVARGAGEQ